MLKSQDSVLHVSKGLMFARITEVNDEVKDEKHVSHIAMFLQHYIVLVKILTCYHNIYILVAG